LRCSFDLNHASLATSVIDADSILKDAVLMGADDYETDMVKERRDLPASESVAAVKSKGPSSTRMSGSVTTSSMKWLENYATANLVAYKAFPPPKTPPRV
jgi:hypothetical protein